MLRSEPGLAAVPDFSQAQLEGLTRSVEQKKQRLEDDIQEYIRRKQEELHKYEQEILEQARSMDRAESRAEPHATSSDRAQLPDPNNHSLPSNLPESSPQQSADSADSSKLGSEESAKRTKHTRVHKREKELYGLVTPIFLPLLDSGEAPPKKKKERRKHREEKTEGDRIDSPQTEQGPLSRDADKGKETNRSRSRNGEDKMDGETGVLTNEGKSERKEETPKKSKRATLKKSSLRLQNTPRPRRKRVSLVIDDQIVLPADNIVEAMSVTSPSETATSSASNSTTSLEELVDPRLMERVDTPVHHEAVHHSVPLHMSLPSTSPTKHTGHTLSGSPPTVEEERQLPQQTSLEYEPPQTATRTYLSPSPTSKVSIPQYASAAPIYSNTLAREEEPEEEFSTYVGGIDGSGVDDVDQAGSYGYPSSLGASYMESYMKSRPLSVRIAAAEKAELADKEKKELTKGEKAKESEPEIGFGKVEELHADVDEDMEVMGSMEGF